MRALLVAKSRLAEGLFLDFRSLANLLAQVVQLCATNVATTNDFNLVNLRRMNREGALYADREADLADGERFAAGVTMTADDVALEHLNALTVTFDDAVMDLDVVANVELRNVLLELLLLDCANDIHFSSFYMFVPNRVAVLVSRRDLLVYPLNIGYARNNEARRKIHNRCQN